MPNTKHDIQEELKQIYDHFELKEHNGFQVGVALYYEDSNTTIIAPSNFDIVNSLHYEEWHPCLINSHFNQPVQSTLKEVIIINKYHNPDNKTLLELISSEIEN